MIRYMHKHPLPLFFGLTFLLSWLIWVPMALDHVSLLPVKLNAGVVLVGRLFGTLGPACSAILVSLLIGGKPAVKKLLGQLGKWRVGWAWYAAAALVFPCLLFIVAGIYSLLPWAAPLPVQPVSASNLIVTAIILTISVLGEEIGWRGFALPRMQQHWPALKTSLMLGTVHTFWHIPFWIVLGELESFGPGYWLLSWAWVLALTIYITWIMNNTGNSLLMALICHQTLNMISVGYLPLTTVIPAYIIFISIAWAIVFVIIRRYGTERLVRESHSLAR